MKLLVVDDDETLAGFLREGLTEEGHVVDVAYDGRVGESAARRCDYDAIVLDVMMPGIDGLTLLRSLRAKHVATPVLMLTARDTADDAVLGLNAGADDYLRKPFEFEELLARLRSITRRDAASVRLELRVADIVFDLATRRVTRDGVPIRLTARESAYLEYFMRNTGLLVTRHMLEVALWNDEAQATSNVIDVYVGRLRSKIDGRERKPLLHTVRGAGYRFELLP